MKEEEARNKMCPMLGIMGAICPSVAKDPGIRCIASECALWVQTDNECDPMPEPIGSDAVIREPNCYPAGHCGLIKEW